MAKKFTHNVKIYYEDTDSGGVVYYANYLKYLERARSEALHSLGLSNKQLLKDYRSLIIVKSCNLDYIKPAMLEDILLIESQVKSMSKTSITMNQIVKKNDVIITKAEIVLVIVNDKGKPVRIPKILKDSFE
tara:strand:+ start:1278 stop:1673 length:396 start_codon:yes stop_codon:yes gene_type:complete